MNAVGVDVSKGRSTVAVMQPVALCRRRPCRRLSCDGTNILFVPFGVVSASPFEVAHTENELSELAKFLKSFSGETKVVMEYTGSYYEPIARFLHNEGISIRVKQR